MADSDINSVTDLKGKRVGMGQPGGTSMLDADFLMRTAGLEPGKDFKDFRVKLPAMVDMLGDGQPICPENLELLDIWQFACETKLKSRTYKKIAKAQGWVSAAGNIRTGAEYAHRFCSGDWGFIESHTALDDARIETEILAACYAAKKRVPYGVVNASPWRIVNA